ncbi:MAG: transposase [Candidatus Zixiibacteriota bacterium]
MKIKERKHRLSREAYKGRVRYAFTICVHNKGTLFVSDHIFHTLEDMLLDALVKSNCDAHIYLFMPDHGHLLIEGKLEESDLWNCVVDFKRKSGFWLARNHLLEEWQKDFYDHILRKDEDLIKQVRYILGNPVRKGLVEDWKAYPYKGSTLYDFDQW